VAGRPMLDFVVSSARQLTKEVSVVVGHQASAVREAIKGVEFIQQQEQLGTGHAVMMAREPLMKQSGNLLILPGDVPLIRVETLRAFVDFHRESGFGGSVITTSVKDPSGYGRIVRRSDGAVEAIREHRDSDEDVLSIREINSSIYIFDTSLLFGALDRVRPHNDQNEYYLTDIVGILTASGHRFGAFEASESMEILGVNSRPELAQIDGLMRHRKCEELMVSGVSIIDPDTAWIDADVEIGSDSVIHPSVCIEGRSVLGEDVTVRSFSRLTNSLVGDRSTILEGCVVNDSKINEDVQIGPHTHLRMGVVLENQVKVGNFVEIKKSTLGEGTKSMHLSYLGDAKIGKKVNVGAGTITCNYDGVDKNSTVIEDGAFIGSDSQLMAPVHIGKNAYVAAGSSITDDVPPESLAIARGRQALKEGWVKQRKEKRNKKE